MGSRSKGTPPSQKGDMMNPNLYVGIDVSGNTLVVGIVDAAGQRISPPKTYRNNLPATEQLVADLIAEADKAKATHVQIATEATGFYDWHLLEHLAQNSALTAACDASIYRLNPRRVKAFSKVYSQTDKTDELDAFFIANCLRFETPEHPFNTNMDYLPLQRLTRFRKHIVEQMAVEKNYFLNHLFLKFSAYHQVKPFASVFGATSLAFLSEFFSPDEVANTDVKQLVDFVIEHSKNRFQNPEEVVQKLETIARESYRIRPALAESVNLVLATTLANIRALKTSLRQVNAAIEKTFAGFTTTLLTIPGIGPIYAAGIFAEIGDIRRFATDAQLAKYAGLAWRKRQSGNFTAEDTPLMRQANAILRYYLVEAANSVKNHNPLYRAFYQKKKAEANRRQHKRALVLTARKLVRLIYAMLSRGEIYQPHKLKTV